VPSAVLGSIYYTKLREGSRNTGVPKSTANIAVKTQIKPVATQHYGHRIKNILLAAMHFYYIKNRAFKNKKIFNFLLFSASDRTR